VNAKVILYGDRVTDSMQRAIEETRRRRALQEAYNREHGITPETVKKGIRAGIESEAAAHAAANAAVGRGDEVQYITEEYLAELEAEMLAAADSLEFERAAGLRDRIERLRASLGKPVHEADFSASNSDKKGRRKGGARVPRPKRGV
jgi:excinuclease ABC subunit B